MKIIPLSPPIDHFTLCSSFCEESQLSGGFEDKLDEKLSLSEDQRISSLQAISERQTRIRNRNWFKGMDGTLAPSLTLATSHCTNCSLCTLQRRFCHAWRNRIEGTRCPSARLGENKEPIETQVSARGIKQSLEKCGIVDRRVTSVWV